MKKLNSTIYHKLLLQAEEAKDRDMIKLSSGLLNTLGPYPEEEITSYNFESLEQDVYQELWKVAAAVISYHDLQSVDAEKVHSVLERFSSKLIEELERSLSVDNTQVGPLESKVPGES